MLRPSGNELQIVATFKPGDNQRDGSPYGSAANASFVFLAQSKRVLILNATMPQGKYGGGTGTAEDPYQIWTAAQMNAIGTEPNDWSKHFKLMADLDLSGFDGNNGRPTFNIIAPDTKPANLYYQGIAFTGVFDGGGHKLSHLTIQGASYLGLFAELAATAAVHDLGIEDVNVTGSGDCIAALAAEGRGSISHCYSTGVVNATGAAQERAYAVGGLIASNFGEVTSCHSTATVTGGTYVGGLMGSNWGIVARCYSAGPVRGGGSVGGFVGENLSIMERCYSLGPVTGDSYVGGLVGENYQGQVNDCYGTGAVSGDWYVGGLVGKNGALTDAGKQAVITRCYSAGAVKGQSYVGGLVGSNVAAVTGSFWDHQTSGQTTSSGGTAKSTAEMRTAGTFLSTGWDFVGETKNGKEDIWWILEGQNYPNLAWEQVLFDDFEDGKPGPLWMSYEPEPQRVRLHEVHGRLEVEAVAQDQDVDAIYAADGWRLDATKPFALRVDFHFGKQGPGNGRVNVGLMPSLDPAQMQWAEFEAGYFDIGPIYLYEVRDGPWVEEQVTNRSAESGTLYMSYNPGTDELYFSSTGYGKPNAWRTVPGLLQGRWAGGPVYVILSGGSEGMDLSSGDAWLDNFTIDTGVVLGTEGNR